MFFGGTVYAPSEADLGSIRTRWSGLRRVGLGYREASWAAAQLAEGVSVSASEAASAATGWRDSLKEAETNLRLLAVVAKAKGDAERRLREAISFAFQETRDGEVFYPVLEESEKEDDNVIREGDTLIVRGRAASRLGTPSPHKGAVLYESKNGELSILLMNLLAA